MVKWFHFDYVMTQDKHWQAKYSKVIDFMGKP